MVGNRDDFCHMIKTLSNRTVQVFAAETFGCRNEDRDFACTCIQSCVKAFEIRC